MCGVVDDDDVNQRATPIVLTVATCNGPSYLTPIATVTGHVGEDYVDIQTSLCINYTYGGRG